MEFSALLRKHGFRFPFPPADKSLREGFSLVEVVLALGIVSFSLIGILTMFPVALDTAKDSKNETRVTVIAQSIFSDLQFAGGTNVMVMLQNATNANDYADPSRVVRQSLISFSPHYVAFDSEGRPIQSISGAQYSNQYNEGRAAYVASVATNTSPARGLAQVEVRIVSPPQAGSSSSSRKTNIFTGYLPAQ